MVRTFAVFAVLSAILTSKVSAQESSSSLDPAITSYITRAVSLSDFDVDGLTVVSTAKTNFSQSTGANAYAGRNPGGKVFVGERVAIYGKISQRQHRIEANEVIFLLPESSTLSGLALVDHLFKTDNSGETLLRADGYVIRIDNSTKTAFTAPLSALSEVQPGAWIAYHGTLDGSGRLHAEQVAFQQNTISDSEIKLSELTNYDPSAVPDDAKQSIYAKFLVGVDPKNIPPHRDAAMQARINRIGDRLIPEFQRTLADTDPRKIHFKFQLIDKPKMKDAWVLPSGIILVPYQIVERLQDDSQLATVLADNISASLEKQAYRLKPSSTSLAILSTASAVGGFFVPGLGLVGVAGGIASHNIQTNLLNQSGRVSLGLLYDAGYDIHQAPVAWWLLSSKPSKTLSDTNLPPRTINLLRTIGIVWHNYPESVLTPQSAPATSLSQN